MKTKLGAALLAGTIVLGAAVPYAAAGGRGAGWGGGRAIQTQTRQTERFRTRDMDRLRLRDGSCVDPATAAPRGEKHGNTYGPGDGTGNMGTGPQDGTGYGAPDNR
ncbi:MAG: hypothetical protein ACM3NF_05950 [Gemmatimonadota bacterium]